MLRVEIDVAEDRLATFIPTWGDMEQRAVACWSTGDALHLQLAKIGHVDGRSPSDEAEDAIDRVAGGQWIIEAQIADGDHRPILVRPLERDG